MTMVNVVTCNANGLQDACKRKEMFLYFKKSLFDAIIVQETHSIQNIEHIWKNEWGGKVLYDNGESNARGVAILFNPKLNVQVLEVKNSGEGRFLIAHVKIQQHELTLVNVYAPNDDQPNFFHRVFDEIAQMKCQELIFAGDLNLVMETNKDQFNRKQNNNNS